MSRENIEVARRAVDGWSAFGETGVDSFLVECYADDCVSEDFPDLPDGASHVGREGASERYRNFVEVWGEFAIEPAEFIDAGDDLVIVVVAMSGRGEESGIPIDFLPTFIWELRDGEIVRDRAFTSRSEAFAAAGLSE